MSNLTYDFPDVNQEREKCKDFLQNFQILGGIRKYLDQLQEIADRETKLLEISLDDIYDYKKDEEFFNNIRGNAQRYIRIFEEVVDELLPASSHRHNDDIFDLLQRTRMSVLASQISDTATTPVVSDIPTSLTRRFEVYFIPESNEKARKLREVKAADIGGLVKVKGMVTRASDVKPQISVVTYICYVCSSEVYQSISGTHFMPFNKCPSQRCKDNKTIGKLEMQTRGCKFVKYQELRLQELPDQVPVGHIPRAMTVHCRGERTRLCGPGDIVTISGLYLTVRYGGFRAIKAGLLGETYLEAMSIEKQKLGYDQCSTGNNDIRSITEIQNENDAYERLASSIAPEIFGHVDVKKALLLQLVGGAPRVLNDGMKIRGDINICLMGDPGVAKSQLLKYIASVAPRGVYTTGKGSSSAGLTAAVVKDPVTGDMSLEGGALVLADRGICCIDEFDKMDDSDRTSIHEVMEQQTISIAKAGITTTLNARASVLAAANPLYGRYNKKKSISENVALPNSLLSRFDLLFLILDKTDYEADMNLAKHVLHVHRYRAIPELQFVPLEPAAIKQYIALARTKNPIVPATLRSYVVESYVSLREKDGQTGPVVSAGGRSRGNDQAAMTPRQLLSILRLGQALARLRLSDTVSQPDIDEAIRLINSSKESLKDDDYSAGGVAEDMLTSIFNVIRDHGVNARTSEVAYTLAEAMVLKKGYTSQNLKECLNEYANMGVLGVNEEDGLISFIDA